jgi:hypothetical protein
LQQQFEEMDAKSNGGIQISSQMRRFVSYDSSSSSFKLAEIDFATLPVRFAAQQLHCPVCISYEQPNKASFPTMHAAAALACSLLFVQK